MKPTLIITCEHGGNQIPERYDSLFAGASDVLDSHRGWDPGALELANALSKSLNAPLYYQTVTRLLIEMNRSLDNGQLFSQYSNLLSADEKELLKQQFYFPYRRPVENNIASSTVPVLHLSIHSFTPAMNGVVRPVDVGLLFDPARKAEAEFCHMLQKNLNANLKGYRIIFNEPYQGTDDGLTTYLRTKFSNEHYTGIEIEVNQQYVNTPQWKIIGDAIIDAVKQTLGQG